MKTRLLMNILALTLLPVGVGFAEDDNERRRPLRPRPPHHEEGERRGPGRDRVGDRDRGRDGNYERNREGNRRRPGSPLVVALDANRDGVIDSEEISGAAVALRRLDKNKDGELTMAELRPGRPPRGPRGEGRSAGRGGREGKRRPRPSDGE